MKAVGIIKDDEGTLNREKATEMAWATAEDTLDECEKEVAGKNTITCVWLTPFQCNESLSHHFGCFSI